VTKYDHPSGMVLEVHKSFSGWWIVGSRKQSGGFRRFKSPVLPPCIHEHTCQANLDAYAKREHLSVSREVESVPCESCHGEGTIPEPDGDGHRRCLDCRGVGTVPA